MRRGTGEEDEHGGGGATRNEHGRTKEISTTSKMSLGCPNTQAGRLEVDATSNEVTSESDRNEKARS